MNKESILGLCLIGIVGLTLVAMAIFVALHGGGA